MKLHPLSKTIRAKLAALLPSSDPCVVVAALAATVSLFSLGADHETALAASFKYIIEESPFPLATQLCSWTILSLIQKVKPSAHDLEMLLEIPISATDLRLHTIYQLLCQLVDLRYRFGRPDQMKAIALSVVTCESGFAAIAGCHFLLLVAESSPELIAGIDEKGHLMKRALRRLIELSTSTDTELAEAIIVEMRLLVDTSGISERVLGLLADQEEFLFLHFVRHVESNQAFLSVAWFSFLARCSAGISRWMLRIKRVLVDSQFPALLVHVLTSSMNRRAISDALEALHFFVNNCELPAQRNDGFFFDAAVSGFFVINQKKNDTELVGQCALERDRHELATAVHNLQLENARLEREKAALQNAVGQEKDRVKVADDRVSRSAEEIESYLGQIAELQDRLLQVSLRAKDKKTKLKQSIKSLNELHTQNIQLQELIKRLEGVEVENRTVKRNNHVMEARIEELERELNEATATGGEIRGKLKVSNQELQEREEALLELQKKCNESQARCDAQQAVIEALRSEKKELIGQIGGLEEDVSGTRLRNSELTEAVAHLEAQNLEVHSRLTALRGHVGKGKQKKSELKRRVVELQHEKRKWESIAKFVHKVGEVKGDAVQTVFGSLGIDA
jgi:predicted  nucleic acid-binding Zn-ribbon protein